MPAVAALLAGKRSDFGASTFRSSLHSTLFLQDKITRSKEDAIEILRGYQAEIGGNAEKFGELASKYSDCSSHTNKGDLGVFQRGMMQKPFEDATYSLKVGQMSDIVETESGVHLIMRTA